MNRLRNGVIAGAVAALATALLSVPPSPASPESNEWEPKDPDLTTPWTSEVGPDNALPDYPRPQMRRKQWKNLNGLWQFSDASADEQPPIGEDLDERVLVPYPIESALSGIKRHEDHMFYRRTFTVPRGWRVAKRHGNRLQLHFGAVDYETKVWINGELATTHRGGYDHFTVDVTDFLRPRGEQEIVVGVTDVTDGLKQPVGKQRIPAIENPGGIFYTPASGIWQTVWMEPVRASHITDVTATTRKNLRQVDVTVDATGSPGHRVRLQARRHGKLVARGEGVAGEPIRLTIKRPKLWTPDHPNLYDLRVVLRERRGRPVDRVDSYFGMRTVGTVIGKDGKRHIVLNGEPIFVNSTLDQGYWPDGIYTAPTDEALAFDLKAHKRLGFNAVRKHIKVEPDRWYYWADRLGLMVWQDMPSFQNGRKPDPQQPARDQFKDELQTMIDQHDGWTSIIGWVPFNEGWGEWDAEATGRIADAVKAADPTRLVNAHSGVNCCDSEGDSGRGDIIDWHQYTGPAAPSPTAERAAIDGEHGGFGLVVDDHIWPGDPGAYQMAENKQELTDLYVQNQRKMLELSRKCGLSGGVYTQITDVETEVNGFFTYDRKVEKMYRGPVRKINEKLSHSGNLGRPPSSEPEDGTPGLGGIHRWALDDGSGTTAADSVGDADLSVHDGATWTEGKSGGALGLDGTGYAETDAPVVDTEGSFSVSAWVKLDETGGGFETAVSQDGDRSSAFFLQYDGGANKFAFSTLGGRAYASEPAEAGRWYHLVGVRDAAAGTYTLYL
ncbi:MAG: glycoside hydrolase family 2, partial [Actinomycetia bacterium]|nr:glycoside hydrolase family 2 [Actinomycetes bacterium]